jgi:predicted RNA binding protein with dsRBD fold (UPF0201 family)
MVEVFKTNIQKKTEAEKVLKALSVQFPGVYVNFDLEDIDNILRVEVNSLVFNTEKLIKTVKESGFEIRILEDSLPVESC